MCEKRSKIAIFLLFRCRIESFVNPKLCFKESRLPLRSFSPDNQSKSCGNGLGPGLGWSKCHKWVAIIAGFWIFRRNKAGPGSCRADLLSLSSFLSRPDLCLTNSSQTDRLVQTGSVCLASF